MIKLSKNTVLGNARLFDTGTEGGGSGGTTDYNELTNKPAINSVLLEGNKSLEDFGIAPAGEYIDKEALDEINDAIDDIKTDLENKAGITENNVFTGDNTFTSITISRDDKDYTVIDNGNINDYIPDTVIGNDGIQGDYATQYGIVDCPNGLIDFKATDKEIELQAGIVVKLAGNNGSLTTIASAKKYTITSTGKITLFLAGGEILEAGLVHYGTDEPTNGTDNFVAWWNPVVGQWQFKSNDTGNVWRNAIATPIADVNAGATGITSIYYIGYRILNDDIIAQMSDIEAVEDKITTINTNISNLDTTVNAYGTLINQTRNDINSLNTSKADKSEIPTKTSQLTNDSGFITEDDIPEIEQAVKSVNGKTGEIVLTGTDINVSSSNGKTIKTALDDIDSSLNDIQENYVELGKDVSSNTNSISNINTLIGDKKALPEPTKSIVQNISDINDKIGTTGGSVNSVNGKSGTVVLYAGDIAMSDSDASSIATTIDGLDATIDSKATKATTLNGYGITDAYTKTQTDNLLANKANISSLGTMATKNAVDYSTTTEANALYAGKDLEQTVSTLTTTVNGKADKATTLSGYGITNAYTKTETNNLLANKVDKETGKVLSSNDFTDEEKTKLAGIQEGAQVNPTSLKNPYSLTIKTNGTSQAAYDGSATKTVNITASNVGALASDGNAVSASKLQTARAIALTGDASGSVDFDGSAAVSIPATLANSGVVAGTYGNLNGIVWISNNGGVKSSAAIFILTAKKAGKFRFNYCGGGEENYDYMVVKVNEEEKLNTKGMISPYYGYLELDIVANDVIEFSHIEDSSNFYDGDFAAIGNLVLGNTNTQFDAITPLNIGTYFTVSNGTYTFVPKVIFGGSVLDVDGKGRIIKANNNYPTIYTLEQFKNALGITDGATYTAGDNITITNGVISATDTTYSTFTDSKSGLVPNPGTASTEKYLNANGGWTKPTNTTYGNFLGCTSTAAGSSGLVPAPSSGSMDKVLKGSGNWGEALEFEMIDPYTDINSSKLTTPIASNQAGTVGKIFKFTKYGKLINLNIDMLMNGGLTRNSPTQIARILNTYSYLFPVDGRIVRAPVQIYFEAPTSATPIEAYLEMQISSNIAYIYLYTNVTFAPECRVICNMNYFSN